MADTIFLGDDLLSEESAWIALRLLHIFAHLWKKTVLTSPSFNHLSLARWHHLMSSLLYIPWSVSRIARRLSFSSWFKALSSSQCSNVWILLISSSLPMDSCPKRLLSHLNSDLRSCLRLRLILLAASIADDRSAQLYLTSWWTSSCSSHHFLKRNNLSLFSFHSPECKQTGIWFEVGLFTVTIAARPNLVSHFSETKTYVTLLDLSILSCLTRCIFNQSKGCQWSQAPKLDYWSPFYPCGYYPRLSIRW